MMITCRFYVLSVIIENIRSFSSSVIEISSVNGCKSWLRCEKYDFPTFPTFSLEIFSEGNLLLFIIYLLFFYQSMIKYNNVNILKE